MYLTIFMIVITILLGGANVYFLASSGAWISAVLASLFVVGGLYEYGYLRKNESKAVARHVLIWVMGSQLAFSVAASMATERETLKNSAAISAPDADDAPPRAGIAPSRR